MARKEPKEPYTLPLREKLRSRTFSVRNQVLVRYAGSGKGSGGRKQSTLSSRSADDRASSENTGPAHILHANAMTQASGYRTVNNHVSRSSESNDNGLNDCGSLSSSNARTTTTSSSSTGSHKLRRAASISLRGAVTRLNTLSRSTSEQARSRLRRRHSLRLILRSPRSTPLTDRRNITFATRSDSQQNCPPSPTSVPSLGRDHLADEDSHIGSMLTRGPRGSVDVMPRELLGRLEGHEQGGIGPVKPLKPIKTGAGGVDQIHTLQVKKGKSEEDLSRSNTMSGSNITASPDHGGSSPGKARFRRRASTTSTKKGNTISLEISNPMPGTFRKVAGVREDRTDGTDGAGVGERTRTVEIDLIGDRMQLGFEFELRKWPTLDVHEVRVTGIDANSVVDAQHLLEIGDALTKVNGVSVAKISNKDELQFLMRSEKTLVLSVSVGSGGDNNAAGLNHPGTADGFFTTPEPPGTARNNSLMGGGGSSDPLRVNTTVAKFVPGEIDPEDMECAYDAIELYPEKKDPNKHGGGEAQPTTTSAASPGAEDDDWDHYRSNRNSLGLVECMEGVVDLLLSKDLTGEERRNRLAQHLGMDVDLPSLVEEEDESPAAPGTVRTRTDVSPQHYSNNATTTTSSSSSDSSTRHTSATAYSGHRLPGQSHEQSAPASAAAVTNEASDDDDDDLQEDMDREDDDDIDADVRRGESPPSGSLDSSELIQDERSPSDLSRIDNLHSLSGVLNVSVFDGAGFIPAQSLRCVVSTDDHFKLDTCRATVDGSGAIGWDENFEMELDDTRSLVVSCFASTGSRRDALSGRTTVQLEALFRVAGTRRLQLTLAPRGSVRLDLAFTERARLLKRFPSDDQYFGVFGIDLGELVARERCSVPHVVAKCIGELDARGLDVPGLYRVAGSFKMKEALRDSFEADSSSVRTGADDVPDVAIIAALLKDYLRELPEPLLTNEFCAELVRAARRTASDAVRQQRLFGVLQQLPAANLDLARLLFRHFHRLLASAALNKLSVRNLSVCLGPILLCPAPHARGTLQESVDFDGMAKVVEAMLDFGWPDNAYTNEETTF